MSRIMAHDRHEKESSRLDKWRMKNMARSLCSPASHAFVLWIAYRIYRTKDKKTREWRVLSVAFSYRECAKVEGIKKYSRS